MTTSRVTPSEITLEMVVDAIGPLEPYAHQCHAASLALVKSGLLPEDWRVARGTCIGVGGQHSWATGPDPYAKYAGVVDVTRWSYEDGAEPYVWKGTAEHGEYRPHGSGSIVDYGKPVSAGGEVIKLTPSEPLSASARAFLRMVEPLDLRGWQTLAHAPVGGWPAAEILAAMDDTKKLTALIPIDVLGMITDRNPGNLYLP